MTVTSVSKSCPYSPHSGPVGCLPAPNIFHLANEFAKGKMFWNPSPKLLFTTKLKVHSFSKKIHFSP